MSLRQQNKSRARASILDAADRLIADKGVASTTTRDIAASAGVSYQTLYNYFPTKADIVSGLLESEFVEWRTTADDLIKRYSGDLITTLEELYEISLASIHRTGKDLWRLVVIQTFNREFSSEEIAWNSSIGHEQYYALLKLSLGMGHLREDTDLHLLAHTLWSLSDHALMHYVLEEEGDAHFKITHRQILELVVRPYIKNE
jgi:AcrR family transcriptional regulator